MKYSNIHVHRRKKFLYLITNCIIQLSSCGKYHALGNIILREHLNNFIIRIHTEYKDNYTTLSRLFMGFRYELSAVIQDISTVYSGVLTYTIHYPRITQYRRVHLTVPNAGYMYRTVQYIGILYVCVENEITVYNKCTVFQCKQSGLLDPPATTGCKLYNPCFAHVFNVAICPVYSE